MTILTALLNKSLSEADIEVIVVESNSTDGSREKVLQFAAHPRVRVVLEDAPRGKGHAVRNGLASARGDIILLQDADLEYDLDDYSELLRPILAGETSFVLGTRHSAVGNPMRHFADAKALAGFCNFGHRMLTGLINLLYRQNLTDPFTMYKVFRRDCISGLEFECNRFDFDCELVCKLLRLGYQPVEIPVKYNSRSFTEGKKVRIFRDPPTWIRAILKYRIAPLFPPSRASAHGTLLRQEPETPEAGHAD
ncbi:MAG: glycosyltransferase family 2 protein [Bryobacteraceae bacterium]